MVWLYTVSLSLARKQRRHHKYETSVAKAGRTSFTVYGKITKIQEQVSDGFVTFVFVDEMENYSPQYHYDEAKSSEEIAIRERAKNLR